VRSRVERAIERSCSERGQPLGAATWPSATSMLGVLARSWRVQSTPGAVKMFATGPCSTIRPSVMTTTRSAIVRMSARSWVMKSRLSPISRRSYPRSSTIAACTETSSAGPRRTRGPSALPPARAIATRWRSPPDSTRDCVVTSRPVVGSSQTQTVKRCCWPPGELVRIAARERVVGGQRGLLERLAHAGDALRGAGVGA
jgi:hypothetical protein